jgi:hypothetical protein
MFTWKQLTVPIKKNLFVQLFKSWSPVRAAGGNDLGVQI